MGDYLVRIISKEASVRAFACVTTDLANEAYTRHQTAPTATIALAQALTGTALMGALLKMKQRLALRIEGNGPLKKLIAESNSYGVLRGYVANPDAELPLDENGRYPVAQAIGTAGLLTMIKDVNLKELATSTIALPTSEIDQDLTQFLLESEQIPSDVRIGVRLGNDGEVAVAGGILLQTMPPHNADAFVALVDQLGELPPVDSLLVAGKTPEEILELWFTGVEYEVLEKRPLIFKCSCSRKRTEKALLSLGREQVETLLEEDGGAVIDCHFCREQYVFDEEDLAWILSQM